MRRRRSPRRQAPPQLSRPRQTYVYYPGTQVVPENVAVKVLNRAHTLTAEVEIPKDGASGVLICHGSNTTRELR